MSATACSGDGGRDAEDLEVGSVDTEEPSADVDLGAAWLDDDTLVFTRIVAGDEPFAERPVRNVRLDIDDEAEPRLVDADHSGVVYDAAVLGDDYLASYADAERQGVVRVAEDGELDDVIAGERSSDRSFIDTAADGSAAVVYEFDPTLQEPPTAQYLRGDDELVDTGMAAPAATVDPSGDIVAGIAVAFGEETTTSLQLWDPDAEDVRTLDVQDLPPGFGLTWTEDDQLVSWTGDSWTVIELTES